jgi:hypothetical protein
MKWLGGTSAFVIALLPLVLFADLPGAQSQTVPLEQIWAYEMPGTRDVRELEPDHFGEQVRAMLGAEQSRLLHSSMTQQIREALPFIRPDKPRQAGPGFAVLGTGVQALTEAYNVLAKHQEPRRSFPAGSTLSVVFFAHQSGEYVHLQKVERESSVIRVVYRFVPHETREITEHFALVPIPNLPIGCYRVEIIRDATDRSDAAQGFKPVSSERARQVVCQPFSFSIGAVNGE